MDDKIPEIKLPIQLPQGEEPPQLPESMISKIDQFLSSPLVGLGIKGYEKDVRQYIAENAGNFEPLVYEYIKSKYPNIYAIIKPEDTKEEPEDEPEPIEKPIPRAAVEYEMIELYKEGYNYTEISDHLNSRYDLNLWPMQISRVIARAKEATKAAQTPKPKLQEAPAEVKNTLPQVSRTQTPDTCALKTAIPQDADSLIVMSTLASCINQWNKIKIYVLMTIAATAGYLIK